MRRANVGRRENARSSAPARVYFPVPVHHHKNVHSSQNFTVHTHRWRHDLSKGHPLRYFFFLFREIKRKKNLYVPSFVQQLEKRGCAGFNSIVRKTFYENNFIAFTRVFFFCFFIARTNSPRFSIFILIYKEIKIQTLVK